MSLTSPGASQWTVNENSFGTQTLQTDNNWSIQHDYSYDSGKSKWFSIGKFGPAIWSVVRSKKHINPHRFEAVIRQVGPIEKFSIGTMH